MKPTYSITVLIYHRTQELVDMALTCIGSIKLHTKDYELIILDNGSTVKYDWEKVCDKYIRLPENKGISYGWNTGLKASQANYKVILGDDVIVAPNWIEGLREAMDQPKCGVANIHVEHLPHGIGVIENYKWPSGACFMVTDNTIKKVGYFDERIFPCNTEDWQYWIRTYQAGLKLYRNYHVSVQHKEGQTVHAKDLSVHTQGLLNRLREQCGFDPVEVFCGTRSIYDALENGKKIVI